MKITRIEYQNFRNFKDHGEIKCSTDGKVTIIYGKNGDGKTTLHQLFQWIFYNKVHFNKTTSTERLYNNKFESECSYGNHFEVMGCIDFEHAHTQYSLKRTYTYKKLLHDSEKIKEEISLQYMDEDYNWKCIENAQERIEKFLPSGLSEYFFFDGESMIADLQLKGKDSASKLKTALFSLFDLDILNSALDHIGRVDLKTSVLGKLQRSIGDDKFQGSINNTISKENYKVEILQTNLEELRIKLADENKKKLLYEETKQNISEMIGGHKSKKDYEEQRINLIKHRDTFLKNSKEAQANFGDTIIEMVPLILISKAVLNAKKKIQLNIDKNKLPEGITHQLINYLLSPTTTQCVCGHSVGDEERKFIKAYLDLLPPKSYTSMFQDFSKASKIYSQGFDENRISNFIKIAIENNNISAQCDKEIRELDELEKKSPDIEKLIITRQEAEKGSSECDEVITNLKADIKLKEKALDKCIKNLDQLTFNNLESQKIKNKILIMEKIIEIFKQRLLDESIRYSQILQENIQELINAMLTSKRKVTVNNEFSVRIIDSYNDESKSEGQFAVVSFAYIGGILKLLQNEQHLAEKEYPLVLDGPFSKLDPEQKQNVINMLPQFAPQVIIFSKEDLHNDFPSESIGRVWTISSNEEKNIAQVKEGYLWK